jgi:hypothetical protein
MSFAAPALPYISVGLGIAQYKQQGAAGKFNQAIQERNAKIAEQEAAQIEKQLEFDIARFNQKVEQLQGQTTTRIVKTGADLSGTGLRILRSNAEEVEKERNIMEYNAKIGQARKFEEANFARIQGQVARQTARTAQIGTIMQTGTSLLRIGGFGSPSPRSALPYTPAME